MKLFRIECFDVGRRHTYLYRALYLRACHNDMTIAVRVLRCSCTTINFTIINPPPALICVCHGDPRSNRISSNVSKSPPALTADFHDYWLVHTIHRNSWARRIKTDQTERSYAVHRRRHCRRAEGAHALTHRTLGRPLELTWCRFYRLLRLHVPI